MPTQYLTLAEFRALSVIPAEFISAIESDTPGFTDKQLQYWSSWIDAQLRKRYDAPFAAPYPFAVQGWLSHLVTEVCYLKRGYDPSDLQAQRYQKFADDAKAEVAKAADAVNGLFDLPLRTDTSASGIVKGRPFFYSEQSPYVSQDRKACTGRSEDRNRGGTYGR